ncbi:MAG TPA: DinB family protein, partial [Chloroflexota bacterium]
MLESWLDYHRGTLAFKCDGLSAEQLRMRAVPPSTLSLLGLVRHMAEVERSWFQRTVADRDAPPIYYTESDRDGDFDNVDDADPDEALATWRRECE